MFPFVEFIVTSFAIVGTALFVWCAWCLFISWLSGHDQTHENG